MVEGINRRRFFEKTAMSGAAAGALLARPAARADESTATRADESAATRADESAAARIVVGVMGLKRGSALAARFADQPGVAVKYVCDVDSVRAENCAQQMKKASAQSPQAIGDFRRILDDDDVDALVCAAPNHWHAPATILACKAGKHVYVEKPCCHNPGEGELMVEAASRHHRAVQMGSQRRSSPGSIHAIEELHRGVIGPVYLARGWYSSARGSIGTGKPAAVPATLDYDLWQGPAPRKPYYDNRIHYNWHWFWHWGNGELGNNGVHTIDLCRWGLGVEYPSRVLSSGGRYHFDDDQETPDTQTVAFEFEGKKSMVWQGLSCNRHGSAFVTFHGREGTMALQANGTYTLFDVAGKTVRTEPGRSAGDTEHIANFLAAIRDDKPLALNAQIAIGYKSTLLCHLGNMAHRTGRPLHCDPRTGQVRDDAEAMAYWTRAYEPGWEPTVA